MFGQQRLHLGLRHTSHVLFDELGAPARAGDRQPLTCAGRDDGVGHAQPSLLQLLVLQVLLQDRLLLQQLQLLRGQLTTSHLGIGTIFYTFCD